MIQQYGAEDKFAWGYDASKGECMVDMIVDPLKVVRTVLVDAAGPSPERVGHDPPRDAHGHPLRVLPRRRYIVSKYTPTDVVSSSTRKLRKDQQRNWCGLIAKRTSTLQHGPRAGPAPPSTYTGVLNSLATSAYGRLMVATSLALGRVPVGCGGPVCGLRVLLLGRRVFL
ncbi:uncharacterized protein C8Q71DRAFT_855597 [Rhodofomes roseus]|uniref:Uncharacterized protein n=1 Tax=Rhodofomes roseus TaxID=34475 RepID=A0ABQ8KPF4_9APHY|nr:uncharacterized protein C8Q71DRAFT_855597 [Rhodofomes roseus]KAH9840312.1 hypothetical protein C8Q71DRAFT_855597 [Rhodofomes roseus]